MCKKSTTCTFCVFFFFFLQLVWEQGLAPVPRTVGVEGLEPIFVANLVQVLDEEHKGKRKLHRRGRGPEDAHVLEFAGHCVGPVCPAATGGREQSMKGV